jgi:phage-related protein
METGTLKPLIFVGTAHKNLKSFPEDVQGEIGYALHEAQVGLHPYKAKALHGFGGAGVLEVRDDYQTDTYRAVYTVKLSGIVYVLHCFQKKAKKGSEMTQEERALIEQRLHEAKQIHAARGA